MRTMEIPAADLTAILARVYPPPPPECEPATTEERIADMIQAGRIRAACLTETQELPTVA